MAARHIYNGLFFFDDNEAVSSFVTNASGFEDPNNILSYRLGDSYSSGEVLLNEIYFRFDYGGPVTKNMWGVYLEAPNGVVGATIKLQWSDDAVSWTDYGSIVPVPSISNQQNVFLGHGYDFITGTAPTETHRYWQIVILVPNFDLNWIIRHMALGTGEFFERGFSSGVDVAGFHNIGDIIGESDDIARAPVFRSRVKSFKGVMLLAEPSAEKIQTMNNSLKTKPMYLIPNFSQEYYSTMMLYGTKRKPNERYDTLITSAVTVEGKGFI